jgi:hypothetical protein
VSRSVVVVLNPHHPYASQLVDELWMHHGLRAVCVHTNLEDRLISAEAFPLSREAVVEEIDCAARDLEECARSLARRYEVVAVLPYLEKNFVEAIRLSRALGLEWTSLDRLELVRDKAGLKEHLRARDPSLRLNLARAVRSADEAMAGGLPERFVLKPNDGYAQREIHFFHADDARRSEIEAAFAGYDGALVLEEYVGGTEYAVQGQVDHAGRPHVWSVLRYVRDHDKPIRDATELVRPSEPVFAQVRDYATRVIDALGIERVPFHLECKVDELGPSLIEVALRPIGMLGALRFDFLHGHRYSTLAWAAHHWVSEEPWGDPGLDWDRYARFALRDILVHSAQEGRVHRVDGAEAVERDPHFWRWLKRPEVGQRVKRTASLFDFLWSATLVDERGSADELRAAERRARALIEVHTEGDLKDRAEVFARRALNRAGVEARRARSRLGGKWG